MEISIYKRKPIDGGWGFSDVGTKTLRIDSWPQLCQTILRERVGTGPLKDNYRRNQNFLVANLIILDFDDGYPLHAAIEKFQHHRCVISTTKSHRREKVTKTGEVKPAVDRFRVFLFPEEPITDLEVFRATVAALIPHLNGSAVDKRSPFDPASMVATTPYMPSTEIVFEQERGQLVPLTKPAPVVEPVSTYIPNTGEKGQLRRKTEDFIFHGVLENNWHHTFYKACLDLKEQNYSQEEALRLLAKASPVGELDETDRAQVDDIFSRERGRFQVAFRPRKEVARGR